MSANTKIEWADHTFNPWIGCTQVSPGCDNCYAKADFDDRKHRVKWGAGQARSRTKTWGDPVRWNKQHAEFFAQHGRRQRVFCASLADVFDNEVDPQWRADLFKLIIETPNLDWLLLTKRIGNAKRMIAEAVECPMDMMDVLRPLQNVWISATICNQEEADRDLPKLERVPAARHFVSIEPMLGPIDLQLMQYHDSDHRDDHGRIVANTRRRWLRWVIVGGESGSNARPMHPDWVRSLRDQCQAAGVPFLFKQWGGHLTVYDRDKDDPDYRQCNAVTRLYPKGRWLNLAGGHGFNGERVVYTDPVGKKAAGRLLDGREWNEVPL